MRAEKLQPEQIGMAGLSSHPPVIKTAELILLRVLKIFTFRLMPNLKSTLAPQRNLLEKIRSA